MAEVRKVELGVLNRFSGVECQVTRRGLWVGGFYDSFVGIEGRLIPWDEFDEARRLVMSKEPLPNA